MSPVRVSTGEVVLAYVAVGQDDGNDAVNASINPHLGDGAYPLVMSIEGVECVGACVIDETNSRDQVLIGEKNEEGYHIFWSEETEADTFSAIVSVITEDE